MTSEWFTWCVLVAALAGILAMGVVLIRGRRRTVARLRLADRALDELDRLDPDTVDVLLLQRGQKAPQRLGQASVARRKGLLVRRGSTFQLSPEEPELWPVAAGQTLLVRHDLGEARYELRCLLESRSRLAALGQSRFGLHRSVLYRVRPNGTVIRRERRGMMRFYVGAGASELPPGATDARQLVDMRAWLWATDLPVDTVRRRLPGDAFVERQPLDDEAATTTTSAGSGWDSPSDAGLPVTVLDFSGGGLLIECGAEDFGRLRAEAGDLATLLSDLSSEVLQLAVVVRLTFPEPLRHLEPAVPPCVWFLARVAAAWIVDDEEGGDVHVRLGLDIMYEVPPGTAVAERPTAWEAIPRGGESKDLVAIHSALNQAAAQVESAMPQRRRPFKP